MNGVFLFVICPYTMFIYLFFFAYVGFHVNVYGEWQDKSVEALHLSTNCLGSSALQFSLSEGGITKA